MYDASVLLSRQFIKFKSAKENFLFFSISESESKRFERLGEKGVVIEKNTKKNLEF